MTFAPHASNTPDNASRFTMSWAPYVAGARFWRRRNAQPLRHSSQFTRAHLTVVLELLVLLAVIAKLTASKENGWAERYKVPAGGRAMSR